MYTMGVSRDTQMRGLKLLEVVLKTQGRDIFEFGYNTLKKRWEKLRKALSASTRFSLQPIPPENCTFFNQLREPTPAYAWLRCEREEDTNCYQVLKTAGISGREGTIFGADARYVRLSVIRSQDDFDLLLQRLRELVSHEDQDQEGGHVSIDHTVPRTIFTEGTERTKIKIKLSSLKEID